MRILHTSDWHLTERLRGETRQPDLVERLKEIAGYLDEHNVDVMVVSGDMFSQCTRWDEVESAVKDVHSIFKPYLLRGGTIVTISGNHDNEQFFSILNSALDLAAPIDTNLYRNEPRPRGRLYIASEPGVLRLTDRKGQVVQFVLLPYPTQVRYLKNENTHYSSVADRNNRLHDELKKRLDFIQKKVLKEQLRSVLIAHIHVRGCQISTPYHLSESDDIIYEPGEIPTHWDYVAYGHIHNPQPIQGAQHVRYAGSIECLNWGEREDKKSVVLIDIGPDGRRGDPVCLPLKTTPFYQVDILDPEIDMQGLRERYPDHQRALVKCRIVYKHGDDLNRLIRELKAAFPRIYEIQQEVEGSTSSIGDIETFSPSHNIEEIVEDYLKKQLEKHPQRDEVLKLARELLVSIQ